MGLIQRERLRVGDVVLTASTEETDPTAALRQLRVDTDADLEEHPFGCPADLSAAEARLLLLAVTAFVNGNWSDLTEAERQARADAE